MTNDTHVKHRSNNQQSGSKKQKNHQTGNKKSKSYMRTNPKLQEIEENRLKRVDDNHQKKNNDKGSENSKQSNQSSNEKGNTSSNQSKKEYGNNRKNEGDKKPSTSDSGANNSEEHEVNHKEQSGKFETAFNRIHKELKEMVKGTDSDAFVELLYSGYKNHSLVRKYKSELHQFAKLRNAIVHERVNADFYIAEPHIEVVERIEEIAREFEKPQTALSIATSPVFYYYEDAYLKDVLKVINKFDFTRFPVYDKDDKYVALLTSKEIIQWMAKHFTDSVVHFEDVRVQELLTNGKNYFVIFVDEDASLYHIEELFERYHTRGKKLQAVIITETGDRHGKPIGVITPWDLLDSDLED
ncbi:CBS domain-containing protein [Mesobacillus subterraneus]|uniref:CBS domain-containing protein n=1 Tax=Mesobacillus subterraneus TaxID=285983 RepID=UPI001CFED5F3|nr:CBS domain-containing protein [Mesobacillus subterraneus]WLR54348.1 CBS domain-containing protein [Mesobacillus subterraneus]